MIELTALSEMIKICIMHLQLYPIKVFARFYDSFIFRGGYLLNAIFITWMILTFPIVLVMKFFVVILDALANMIN